MKKHKSIPLTDKELSELKSKAKKNSEKGELKIDQDKINQIEVKL